MNERIVIGKIIGAHGIRGEVKVFPITDNVRRFNKLKKCVLQKEDGSAAKEMNVSASRVDRGNALVLFEGINDRTLAERLKGLYLSVDREDAVKLPKDSYFIADLIGSEVIDDTLGSLGVVEDVFETGANQVLQIKRPGKKDLLLPFLKVICYEIKPSEGYIKCILPDGLYELYEG